MMDMNTPDPNNSFVVQHSNGPLCLNIKIDMSALLRLTCTDFVLKILLQTINCSLAVANQTDNIKLMNYLVQLHS